MTAVRPMNLGLSPDQELLRETTARFIASSCPLTRVRELFEHPAGIEPDYQKEAAALGWFAMLVPEELGGGSVSGAGLLDAVVIAEERGRAVQPGPFLPVNVVAAAIAESGRAEQRAEILPALAAGEAVAAWALADARGSWQPGGGVTARPEGSGFVLTGTAGFVQDAQIADWLLVSAPVGAALTQFLVRTATAGTSVVALQGLDLGRRLCEVRFDDVVVDESALLGGVGTAGAAVERQLQVAVALQLAEMVGTMDQLFEMTREYAIDRLAFGRPIGSFQAVKHALADISLRLEAAKAGALDAARAVQHRRDDAGEVVSMVKSFTAEVGIELSQQCLQTHGGIGFTWEHDLHLYMRRIASDAALYGDSVWHLERICRLHGLGDE